MSTRLQDVDHEWPLALAHAGVAPEEAAVFVVPGPGPNDAEAIWFRPGPLISTDELPDAATRAQANSDRHRRRHRVCVWADGLPRPVVGALVRHELEHARQWDALHARIDDLYQIALDLLRYKAGGLYGCMALHVNTIPAERDCDAAAAAYLREHHAEAVAELCCGDHRKLACSLVGPQSLDTLVARMVAWMFVNRDLCEARVAGKGYTFASVLEMCASGSGARAIWEALADAAGAQD